MTQTGYATRPKDPQDEDFLFFGFVIGLEKDVGYFSLSELTEPTLVGFPIERRFTFQAKVPRTESWRENIAEFFLVDPASRVSFRRKNWLKINQA